MKLFVYSRKSVRKSDGVIDRLQGRIESCMQGKITEMFNSVESLSRRLCRPNTTREETIAVLFTVDIKDLLDLIYIRDLLDDIGIILILPDDKKETISAGHRLRPRYISYTDGNFKDVAAVLNKMEGLFRKNKNNHRWRV